MSVLLLILGMALLTYLQRLLPLALIDRASLPAWVDQGMNFITVAILAALIGAALVPRDDWLSFTVDGRLLAGLVAIGLAKWTGNTFITLAGGLLIWALLS